jgi:hypothetical protein
MNRSCPDAFLSAAKSPESFSADVAELRRVLDYNPESGVFRWKVRVAQRTAIGAVAGEKNAAGYLLIGVLGARIRAHRLAWIYSYGTHPAGDIDHIDGNRLNNALCNLRDVTRQMNLQNQRRPRSDGTTGYLGVSIDRRRGMFRAQIALPTGQQKFLGYHERPQDAHAAYLRAKRQLHEGCTL